MQHLVFHYFCSMSKKGISVIAVEYLNTALFVRGLRDLKQQGLITLSLNNPAFCAENLRNGIAQVGLVPVAAIPELKPDSVFSKYCIGAKGPVHTVRLLSNKPLKELKTILLDSHSRTSARLVELLAKKYWGIEVSFKHAEAGFEKGEHSDDTGILVIGDKVFAIEDQFSYSLDLADEWTKWTGMPFVFAVWVSMIPIDDIWIEHFNQALSMGLKYKDEIASEFSLRPGFEGVDVQKYLTTHISYSFEEDKKKGMKMFLDFITDKEYDIPYK